MDSSMNSINKSLLSSKTQTQENDSPEESSWTFYIQDFIRENNNEQSCFTTSSYENPSLVTNYNGSSPTQKGKDIINNDVEGFSISTFRKRKVKRASVDDDLEDTASSPVNSPKVSYMNEFQMKQKDKASIIDIPEGKRNFTSNENGLAIIGGDSDISELKKRGLCLVPLSTIANHFR